MRQSYDAIVIGLGPAACVAARHLADAGRSVAMLPVAAHKQAPCSDWLDYWAVPCDGVDAWGAVLNLTAAKLIALSERVIELEDAGSLARCGLVEVGDFRATCLEALANHPRVRIWERERLLRYAYDGERVAGVHTPNATLLAPVVLDTSRACHRVEVRPGEHGLFDAMVWGRYLGVSRGIDSAVALASPSGARFWILPIDELQASLGVEVRGVPAVRVASAAQLWEDELVGCPQLAQQLMNAQLLPDCPLQRVVYQQTAPAAPEGLWPLRELDAPTPLGFSPAVLIEAAQRAKSLLQDAVFS
jgi:hypothetical protein